MAGIINSESQSQKPRVILAATGSVASVKFEILCRSFCEWAEVKAVITKSSLHFIKKSSLPNEVIVLTDDDEWSSWNKLGDGVLHIELRKWADLMVIAPLSANTLAKVCLYFHCLQKKTSLCEFVWFSIYLSNHMLLFIS